MQFELNSALIDEILFFMEDKDGYFLLDTEEKIVINPDLNEADEETDADRYINLPEWTSSDGFRLMEHFTANLRNALVREELSAALNSRHGVFRAYKNVLSQYPEIEKRWYDYKDSEMKHEVISWYNSLRESWGLEQIGEEPEETGSLIHEDFQIRKGASGDIFLVKELHSLCVDELKKTIPVHESIICNLTFPGDISFVAETADGEFAGFLCAISSGLESEKFLQISAIVVKPEYRGLGIGKALVEHLLKQADAKKAPVIIDIPAGQENFSRALLRENFKPCITRYYRGAH